MYALALGHRAYISGNALMPILQLLNVCVVSFHGCTCVNVIIYHIIFRNCLLLTINENNYKTYIRSVKTKSPYKALRQEVMNMFRTFWWNVITHWLSSNFVHGSKCLQVSIWRITSQHLYHCTANTPVIKYTLMYQLLMHPLANENKVNHIFLSFKKQSIILVEHYTLVNHTYYISE